MGIAKRQGEKPNESPGPCAYLVQMAPKLSGATVLGRPEPWPDPALVTPGPGSYSPLDRQHLAQRSKGKPVGTFGTSPRQLQNGAVGPGPAAYAPQAAAPPVKQKAQFSQARRTQGSTMTNPTGPGQYDVPAPDRKLLFSMPLAQRQIFSSTETPGPGEYSPVTEAMRHTGPAFGFGKAKRSLEKRKDKPEKDALDDEKDKTERKPARLELSAPSDERAPTWSFGKGKRPPLSVPTNVPVPGTYQAPPAGGAAPVSMKTRRGIEAQAALSSRIQQTPGPGAYGTFTALGARPARTPNQSQSASRETAVVPAA